MKKTFLTATVIATGLFLGTSSFAFAQQGLTNRPASDQVAGQTYTEGTVNEPERDVTTGYSTRSDRDVPRGWSDRRRPPEPVLPSPR